MKNLIRIYDGLRERVLKVARLVLLKPFSNTKLYGKILIVRKGTIGDHSVCQPIYLAVKTYFNNSQIHLLTSNGGNEYAHISNLPESVLFDETLNFEDFKHKELIETIKAGKYDLVIELPQDLDTLYTQLRNMFFYRYCGIDTGAGWAAGLSFMYRRFRYSNIELPREFQKHKSNLMKQGVSFNIPETYLEPVKVDLSAFINPELDLKNAIVIAPGAKIKSKQWPTLKYQLLIEKLLEKGFSIVIIGTVEEGKPFTGLEVINLCGQLTIHESKYLLSQSELLICNDSGPMHLGYSAGSKLIALFGGRSYPKAWWPPTNSQTIVIHKHANYPVAYIGDETLDNTHDGHLESISVDEVLDSVDRLIHE